MYENRQFSEKKNLHQKNREKSQLDTRIKLGFYSTEQ